MPRKNYSLSFEVTRVVTYTCRYSSGHLIPKICFLLQVSLGICTKFTWIINIQNFTTDLPSQPFLGRHLDFNSFHPSHYMHFAIKTHSGLTMKTKYNFMFIHSPVISCPNKTKFDVEVSVYQWRPRTGFEVNCIHHSWDMSLQKLTSFLCFCFFYFFSFLHTCKKITIKHRCVIRLPSNLAHITRDIRIYIYIYIYIYIVVIDIQK